MAWRELTVHIIFIHFHLQVNSSFYINIILSLTAGYGKALESGINLEIIFLFLMFYHLIFPFFLYQY